jgi:hypothetical protein
MRLSKFFLIKNIILPNLTIFQKEGDLNENAIFILSRGEVSLQIDSTKLGGTASIIKLIKVV